MISLTASARAVAGGLALLCVGAATSAGSQTPPQGTFSPDRQQGLDARRNKLHGLEDNLKASVEKRRKLEANIEAIRSDRARFNAALIATNAKVQAAESRTTDLEKQLKTAEGSEAAIRRTLNARRTTIGEVLATLQRMGRHPPPAVLVRPDDMLGAVHAAMLLADVLPEMHREAVTLADNLADLATARKTIAEKHAKLAAELRVLRAERQRLAALVAARQSSLHEARQALAAERSRSRRLAMQATDLKDLIARMAADAATADHGAEAAPKPAAAAGKKARTHVAVLTPFKNLGRLAPAIAFADAKGMLPLPVSGTIVKSFGAANGFGGVEKGISIATGPNAAVSSPTDGWIAFSGPYRTYGQILIINAGGGYYVVLAGLARVNVVVQQFVLAGEPVGSMGKGSAKTAAAIAIGATQPILYVEFRKDGVAIDPSPWWAKSKQEKVRG